MWFYYNLCFNLISILIEDNFTIFSYDYFLHVFIVCWYLKSIVEITCPFINEIYFLQCLYKT